MPVTHGSVDLVGPFAAIAQLLALPARALRVEAIVAIGPARAALEGMAASAATAAQVITLVGADG